MTRAILFIVATIFLCGSTSFAQENNSAPDGFAPLFNGENLDGWFAIQTYNPRKFQALSAEDQAQKIENAKQTTSKFWRVEEGEIVNDGKGPFLTTDRMFRDFELLIEYRTVALADSGIYLKATPQVQIWDSTEKAKFKIGANLGSGGLWNNSAGAAGKDPSAMMDKPFGEWNRFRIRQIGARTSVWLNGTQIVDHAIMENYWGRTLPLINKGRIQLQTHGGEIRWRNVFVREIPADEANKMLAENSDEGFESIFDGESFKGWAGPIDNYEIENGLIRCKPHKGGTIYSDQVLEDFVARLEFRLPPGGNNGLAIRYPGSGDTAYKGMCELQVLDSEHPKFKNLDPRQYHGSAYGMKAAERGYLRETGEWNFQEVTVSGSTIRVELNGSVILNCDVSAVKEFMAKPEKYSGRTRTSGYFGLAGHSDPVEFRHLKIKRLGKIQNTETED